MAHGGWVPIHPFAQPICLRTACATGANNRQGVAGTITNSSQARAQDRTMPAKSQRAQRQFRTRAIARQAQPVHNTSHQLRCKSSPPAGTKAAAAKRILLRTTRLHMWTPPQRGQLQGRASADIIHCAVASRPAMFLQQPIERCGRTHGSRVLDTLRKIYDGSCMSRIWRRPHAMAPYCVTHWRPSGSCTSRRQH